MPPETRGQPFYDPLAGNAELEKLTSGIVRILGPSTNGKKAVPAVAEMAAGTLVKSPIVSVTLS